MRYPPHSLGWKIDYTATDEQLRAFGVEQRIIDLARQSYLRPTGKKGERAVLVQDMDLGYVNRINEAKDQVALAALAINNPDVKAIWYPPYGTAEEALVGLVRHES